MELHDDDPDHFEFVLKFIYTLNVNANDVKFRTNDTRKTKDVVKEGLRQVQFILGVYIVTDKDNIEPLLPHIANHLKDFLAARPLTQYLEPIIEKYYGVYSAPNSAAGQAIASSVIHIFSGYAKSSEFANLPRKYPIFAADIAGYYHQEGMFDVRRFKCYKCKKRNVYLNTDRDDEDDDVDVFCSSYRYGVEDVRDGWA
jgi:hypothetical protein